MQTEKAHLSLKFSPNTIKFSSTFFKRCRGQGHAALVALRRARNPDIGVFFFIAFSFAPAYAKEKARRASDFFFWLLAVLGLYLVWVGAVDAPLLSRGEHCSLAKKHRDTFLISYFCMTKSTKSQQGGLAPSSFQTTGGVHESVARAMRGKYVRRRIKQKSVVLPLPATSTIPRARTYHTKKPSRFVHALPARPL